MSDLPPDLDRLRTLETYLRLQLDAVRAAIHRAEQDAPPVGDRSPRALAAAERLRRDQAVPYAARSRTALRCRRTAVLTVRASLRIAPATLVPCTWCSLRHG
jgi:hypothetical protein